MEDAIRSCWKLRRSVLTGVLSFLILFVLSPSWVTAQLPKPKHIVIVVEENHSYEQVIDSSTAPYLNNELVAKGALLTEFFAGHHPSQPNYIVLFSGDRYGIENNKCSEASARLPVRSLGGLLVRNGMGFIGYAEDLPEVGSPICELGKYARKHAPWVSFADVPTLVSLPFSDFPTDFNNLPKVAMVIPNLENDMHDPVIPIFAPSRRTTADTWLRTRLGAYAEWAQSNNSLLIITWDEDNDTVFSPKVTKPPANHVATIFFGQMVIPGKKSAKQYDHVDLLKTIVNLCELPEDELSKGKRYSKAKLIDDIWK